VKAVDILGARQPELRETLTAVGEHLFGRTSCRVRSSRSCRQA
jgi:hypothetical protein